MTGTGTILPAESAAAIDAALVDGAGADSPPAMASAFHVAPTDVMSVPAEVKAAAERSTQAPAGGADFEGEKTAEPVAIEGASVSADVEPTMKQTTRAPSGGDDSDDGKRTDAASAQLLSVPAYLDLAVEQNAQAPSGGVGFADKKTVQTSTSQVEEKPARGRQASAVVEACSGMDAKEALTGTTDPGDDAAARAPTEVVERASLAAIPQEPSSDSVNAAVASRGGNEPPQTAGEEPETASAAPDRGDTGSRAATRPSLGPAPNPNVDGAPLGEDLGRPFDDERPEPRSAKGLDAIPRPPRREGLPPLPVSAIVGFFGVVGRRFMDAPVRIKVVSSSVALVAVIVSAIGLASLTRGEKGLYVDEKTALMSGPGSEPTYRKIADLRRGAELVAYSEGSVGDWVMVRDVMGRAGFVNAASLSDSRPVSLPGHAFAGCAQSPIETGIDACQARAQVQLNSCRSTCDTETDPTTCSDYCQKQFLACVRGCEGAASEVVEIPTSSPTLDEPPSTLPVGTANRGETQPAKKKARKKARRKKKRRR